MAQKAYVGVGNAAHNVKDIYVGVNGVARKVVKGYVGVNGVARQFWGATPVPVVTSSWDFWSSVAGTTLFTIEYNGTSWSYQKANNMIAYYAIICVKPNVGNINYFPLFLSPVSTATSFQTIPSSSPYIYSGSVTDKMGISWRYASGETAFDVYRSSISPQGCLLNTIETYYTQNTEGIRQAALDLLDRIYSVPFHEDYQLNNTYTLTYFTDKKKTIRKVLGIFLWWGYLHPNVGGSWWTTAYSGVSKYATDITTELLNRIGSDNYIYVTINFDRGTNAMIYVYHTTQRSFRSYVIEKDNGNGYNYVTMSGDVPYSMQRETVGINSSTGVPVYTTETITDRTLYPFVYSNMHRVGECLRFGVSALSNIGIELGQSIGLSWDYWTTVSGTINDLGITKTNNKIAYYAVFKYTDKYYAILASTQTSAAAIQGVPTAYSVRYNNIEWMYCYKDITGTSFNTDCLLDSAEYDSISSAAYDLVQRIYAVPFEHGYTTGISYTLHTTNARRTIRKALGTFLHMHIDLYSTTLEVKALSDNADNVINFLIGQLSAKGCLTQPFSIIIWRYWVVLNFGMYAWLPTPIIIDEITGAQLYSKETHNYYDVCNFNAPTKDYWGGESMDPSCYPDWYVDIELNDGNIVYNEAVDAWDVQATSIPYMAGIYTYDLYDDARLELTNLGVNL